jgi:hypothetical protein
MILRDSLFRRNVAEYATLLLVIASHVYKDDAGSFFVTAESAFFRNLLGVRRQRTLIDELSVQDRHWSRRHSVLFYSEPSFSNTSITNTRERQTV